MPLNAGYEYANAEKVYLNAKTLEERIVALEGMIRAAPKHKSSEHHVSELKNRLRRFKEKKEKSKKVGKTTFKSIRKEGFQCVLVGFTNSGKSSLLAKLTNARPKISNNQFTTSSSEIGTLDYQGYKAQVVDMPSIGSDRFDIGLVNTADCIIIVLENLEQLPKIQSLLVKATGKQISVLNKSDFFDEEEQRKIKERIKSKKLNTLLISTITEDNLSLLKDKIISLMPYMRVYMKEPGKSVSNIALVLKNNSNIKEAADSVYKGFSLKIKEARITGPSSKFPNQKVGLSHILKDKDIIEFHTK